jgi:hypothetical protein
LRFILFSRTYPKRKSPNQIRIEQKNQQNIGIKNNGLWQATKGVYRQQHPESG